MKLVNRVEELAGLEEAWHAKGAQLVVMYGKRRVGKTSLIHAFVQRKPYLYFLADKTTESENLKRMGQVVGKFFHDAFLEHHGFTDWYELFDYVQQHVTQHMVFAIDEFPYLAESNKAVSSIFQKGWDEQLKRLPLFVILCGSSIGMMERETLAYQAPLYGRRTAQLFVKPLTFFDAWDFYPDVACEAFLNIFAIAGGNPAYLLKLKDATSLRQALTRYVFKPIELLFEEVEFILKEELREPRQYMSILRAIASGCRKFGEIINDTGMEKGSLHKYLFTLEDLHLIEKEVPATEKHPEKSRRGLYRIQDQFVAFWFNHVYPFKGEIEMGNTRAAIAHWEHSGQTLVQRNYELVARELVRKHQARLFPLSRVGRWWEGREEIDVVAVNEQANAILFGEAKWSRKQLGTNIYEDLKRKSHLVSWGKPGRQEHFALFSKSGFTAEMKKLAASERVVLFEQDQLVR